MKSQQRSLQEGDGVAVQHCLAEGHVFCAEMHEDNLGAEMLPCTLRSRHPLNSCNCYP